MIRAWRVLSRSGSSLGIVVSLCLGGAGLLFLGVPCPAQSATASQTPGGPRFINVAVRGAVAKPGRFDLPVSATATAALQAAGGLLPLADKRHAVIRHERETSGVAFSCEAAQQHPVDTAINLILRDGDTLVVPVREPSAAYTLAGPGICNPAEYALSTATVSLATAIGRAGGLEDRADVGQIRILRTKPGGSVTVLLLVATDPRVLAKFQVQAGDQIVIGREKSRSKIFVSSPPIPRRVASL